MSLVKTAVFLASRFDEFAPLRATLRRMISDLPAVQLAVIDMNDGNVSHRPPLTECLANVRRSEFMILLMGDSYGSLAPRQDKSFTHLEYEEAIKEGSSTRVLVFCIGESYRDGRIHHADDPRLAAWQRQVEENHTIDFLEHRDPPEVLAHAIREKLLFALHEMRLGAVAVDASDTGDETFGRDLFEADEDSMLDDGEVTGLEERNALNPDLRQNAAEFSDPLAALMRPASVAAREQREQAQIAIDIGRHGVAISHLCRALEHEPLDLLSNYWLAQLYVALGRKEKAAEAIEKAELAAHVANHEGRPYRAAAAYVVAARAARLARRDEEAMGFARKAVEEAPRFARAHVELARQLAACGNVREALPAIRQAFTLYPASLQEVFADPTFLPMRSDIDTLLKAIKARILRDVDEVLQAEATANGTAGATLQRPAKGQSLGQLFETARQSAQRHYQLVANLLTDAATATHGLDQPPAEPIPVNRCSFEFKKYGQLQVARWLKQPGDELKPHDTVLMFRTEHSDREHPWRFHERGPARMKQQHVLAGGYFDPESPHLFDWVDPRLKEPEWSPIQRLKASLVPAVETLQQAQEHVSRQMVIATQARQAWATSVREGAQVPGTIPALAGAACLAGALFTGLGPLPMVGMTALLALVGLFLLVTGLTSRGDYKRTVADLEQDSRQSQFRLEELEHAETECQASVDRIRQGIEDIQRECEAKQAMAAAALDRFERKVLAKPKRLLPFASINAAKPGALVRIFVSRGADPGGGRALTMTEDLPTWATTDGDATRGRLVRVTGATPRAVSASPLRAYLPDDVPA